MSELHMSPPPLSPQAMADLLCTLLVFCRGKRAGGRDFWAYMCIKPSMAGSFKEARDRGSFVLEDYGTVIEWGEGDTPPMEVRARMAHEYGADDDYENKLLQAIELQRRLNY